MSEVKVDNMPYGAKIPASLLREAALNQRKALGIVLLDHTLVLVPGDGLSAMDIIQVLKDLRKLSDYFMGKIAEACEACNNCGESVGCELITAKQIKPAIQLPPDLMREAGIRPGSKLTCLPDAEDGVLRIAEADYRFDLTDVPSEILQQFRDRNVCLNDLEDLLMSEDIVDGVCHG